ncbi:MAG: twin-arginine translocase TatA/TatE family subunit [Candidatus Calescibacterium sp.]|jgi:sec-independent protein translocase protein TatA|nr:twin-arginine translocase TatA/TatE family subunit [Candidatus Calescibacterium sp.]
MAGIGFQELLIIFLIIALLFGAKKIPELAKGLGQAMREFKKGMRDDSEEEKNTKNPDSGEKIIEEKTKSKPEEKIIKTASEGKEN